MSQDHGVLFDKLIVFLMPHGPNDSFKARGLTPRGGREKHGQLPRSPNPAQSKDHLYQSTIDTLARTVLVSR